MGQLSIRDFPDDLQRQARIEAIEAGESLKDLVIEAVRREVERRRAERPDRPR